MSLTREQLKELWITGFRPKRGDYDDVWDSFFALLDDTIGVGLWNDRGGYDASVNAFPSTGGSGVAGAILRANVWTVSVEGTLGGTPVAVGQTVRALVDSPGQIASNWNISSSGSKDGIYIPTSEPEISLGTPNTLVLNCNDSQQAVFEPRLNAGTLDIDVDYDFSVSNTSGTVAINFTSQMSGTRILTFPTTATEEYKVSIPSSVGNWDDVAKTLTLIVPTNSIIEFSMLKFKSALGVPIWLVKVSEPISGNVDPAFKFTITTPGTFSLPTEVLYTYNAVVNWGDGNEDTITTYDQAEVTHIYASAGTYQISINGKFGAFRFNNSGDRTQLISIDNWGDTVKFDVLTGFLYGCSNLTSIAPGAIDVVPAQITSLLNAFRETGSLTAVSSGMLANCTAATTIEGAFRSSGITHAPSGLFDNLTQCTTAKDVFVFAGSLSTIGSDLFRYCTLITNFSGAFQSTGLTTIPIDTFRYNTGVTNFDSTFEGALSLTGIPNNLFFYNPLVTIYNSTFRNCRNMVLPSVIFDTANLGAVTIFDNFMTTNSTSYSSTGTIQDVWTFATIATSVNAFFNQTNIANYASIPNGWKGL